MTEEEIKGLQAEIEGLKKEKAGLAAQLNEKSSKLADMEQRYTAREAETGTLRQAVNELKTTLNAANEGLGQAIASYRSLAAKANPETLAEMIAGDSIEAIDKSVEIARLLVGKVKETLETKKSGSRIPAGSPPRSPADLSALTAREKIQQAIQRK